ncbi:MAG: hypothetical protein FWH12_01900 [Treponema sp.]|nr:hypothetical protein [Treponema sp.]
MAHGDDLLRLLPPVLRARGYRLYLEGGRRLVDLYLQGGRAILGHKAPGFLLELKNAGERGLFSGLPHPLEGRLLRALALIFPQRSFRLYQDRDSLERALDSLGCKTEDIPPWRPLSGEPQLVSSSLLLPVLPLPLGPEVLVLTREQDELLPPGDLIPPVILAPGARAIHQLIRFMKEAKAPRLSLGKSSFEGRGIYLRVKSELGEEGYRDLFKKFLEGGYLIPPVKEEPLIIPPELSKGEWVKLRSLVEA